MKRKFGVLKSTNAARCAAKDSGSISWDEASVIFARGEERPTMRAATSDPILAATSTIKLRTSIRSLSAQQLGRYFIFPDMNFSFRSVLVDFPSCRDNGMLNAPDAPSRRRANLHFRFGNNWMARAATAAYQLDCAREQGGQRSSLCRPVAESDPVQVAADGGGRASWRNKHGFAVHQHDDMYHRSGTIPSTRSGILSTYCVGVRCRAYARRRSS